MRILFGSWPAYGHLLPMVPLIRAAQRAGHEVLVSSGEDVSGLIGRLGVAAHRSGRTAAQSWASAQSDPRIADLPAEQQRGFVVRQVFGVGAVHRARDILDLLNTWRPDLVVHDTLELGSATAAAMHGIRHLTHGYGPTVPGTGDLAMLLGSAIAEDGLPDPVPAVLAAPYLEVCPPSLRGAEPNPWTDIRPLRPSAGEIGPDAAPPVDFAALPHPDTAYLTLGTFTNDRPALLRTVIDGCLRWPINLILTTGPGRDPGLLGPLPPAVHAAQFLPQAAVLPHCRVVVSHAGAGTMLGAACHALPQLCLPQGTDQPHNTAALLPTGAALALDPTQVTADTVADALGRLLNEPTFHQAATRLRTEIDHMPTADTALRDL